MDTTIRRSRATPPTVMLHRHFRICFLLGLAAAVLVNAIEDEVDTREGENLTLKCRFNQQRQVANEFLYYWARSLGASFENVAIGNIQLNTNYIPDFRPKDGTYDLLIKNASYSRDNGRFECRIKAVGTGADVHQEYYNITVLTLPDKPIIEAGLDSVATEGKPHQLTCSSAGGSPPPTITWYREDSAEPLAAKVTDVSATAVTSGGAGGAQVAQTRSTLTLTPRREDDEAKFRCAVWNRAMGPGEGRRLETTVILSVNYHPRVEVGPANPLQVERDATARLECNVDAKPRVTNVRWTHNGRFISAAMVHLITRVSTQDAGLYVCSADNGLGKMGEQEITLDVLTPPAVVIETKTREAEEGETIRISCSVTANPKPVTVEWLKEGDPSFRYAGDTLELRTIRADHAGTYVCRAVNIMMPHGENRVEREGNSTVTLLIRHRPGQASISPAQPVVHANNGVTLTCTANPPGWPVPQYRWFRDTDGQISTKPILAQGSQYVIPRVHFGSEGRYHCLAANELGNGEVASVTLVVHQAPQFLAKLTQHLTKQVGDSDVLVTCSAKGKPKPTIHWLKDGREISADLSMYDVRTTQTEGVNGMMTVQSVLRFAGKARPNGNEMMSADRGQYACLYQNEVDVANSSMLMRIEHPPIVQHRYNKVAYDLRENAEIVCKVLAYPKPEFHWQFGKNAAALSTGSAEAHYSIETTVESNDMYTSVLRIRQISHQDYGDYLCRVSNNLDTVRAHINLQPKGAPERPTNMQSSEVGPNYVQLAWDSGFDGGLKNTKFFVSYRKVAMPVPAGGAGAADGCGANMVANTDWMEFDCQQSNPCVVKHLDQHQAYMFKVKALNTKGASKNSNDIVISTKVAHVPHPQLVSFDPGTRRLKVEVDATCLSLIAIAESVINENTPLVAWQIVESMPVHSSGTGSTQMEQVIEHLVVARRSSVRSMSGSRVEEGFGPELVEEEELSNPRVRVKLCLNDNHEMCGEYTEAAVGRNLVTGSMMSWSTIIFAAVGGILFLLLVTLGLLFKRCKRTQATKSDDSSMRSAALTAAQNQENQEPPPYYPASALHNKSMDHSMDLALTKDGGHKESLYGTQNDYVYYPQPTHQLPDSEWLNTGYPVNTNYAHSNNGGSVNSEDSVWQMKMGLAQQHAASNANSNIIPAHQSALDLHHQQQQQQMQHQQHGQQLHQHQQQQQPTYGIGVGLGLGYDTMPGGTHYGQTPVHDDAVSYSYQPNLSLGGGMLMGGGGGGSVGLGGGGGGGMPDEYSYNTMRSTHSTSRGGGGGGGQPMDAYGADAYAGVPVANSGVVGGGHMDQQIGVNSYFQV